VVLGLDFAVSDRLLLLGSVLSCLLHPELGLFEYALVVLPLCLPCLGPSGRALDGRVAWLWSSVGSENWWVVMIVGWVAWLVGRAVAFRLSVGCGEGKLSLLVLFVLCGVLDRCHRAHDRAR
jgi:hypothetical protein